MKHFIWMLCGIFVSGLLLGTLSACGAAPAPGETEVPAEASAKDTDRRLAYGKALWDMYLRGVLPDGTELERATDLGPAEGNQFAVEDVNGDGEKELIVYWTNACTAGMQGLVYGFDGGALRLELSAFPDLTFYGSGTARAGWSHNQGWAGRFWPFTLYQYSPEGGVYEQICDVDAWDLSVTAEDETLAAAFPREADTDGDGLVYYILTGDWYQASRVPLDGNLSGQLWGTDPVDGAALEEWLNTRTEGEEPLALSVQELNEENIAALGYPRPEVSYPEPAG